MRPFLEALEIAWHDHKKGIRLYFYGKECYLNLGGNTGNARVKREERVPRDVRLHRLALAEIHAEKLF